MAPETPPPFLWRMPPQFLGQNFGLGPIPW